MENLKYDTTTLSEMLHAGEVTVKFLKTNGDIRTMRCTLQNEKLPVREREADNLAPKPPTDTMSVWDLDVNGWRAFRVSSIIDVTV